MILFLTGNGDFLSFSFRAGGNDHMKPVLLVQAGVVSMDTKLQLVKNAIHLIIKGECT